MKTKVKEANIMKTAIIYYSKHHGNTKALLDYISAKHDVTLIDAVNATQENLEGCDAVGFSSGIYYSKFHKSVLKFAENALPDGKKVFFIYTYGAKKDGYTKAIREAVSKHSAEIVGEYGCYGFNTFGPFKLIGGIAKGHPDKSELDGALKFFEGII